MYIAACLMSVWQTGSSRQCAKTTFVIEVTVPVVAGLWFGFLPRMPEEQIDVKPIDNERERLEQNRRSESSRDISESRLCASEKIEPRSVREYGSFSNSGPVCFERDGGLFH